MGNKKEIFGTHTELFNPTKEEIEILKKHEKLVEFKIVPSTDISEGRQSRVSILEYKAGDETQRVIWKRMGAGKGLNLDEAVLFASRLEPYQKVLRDYGWDVPDIFHNQVVAVEGEYQIFSYEKLISGGDGKKMVINPKEPNFRKWFLLKSVVDTLAKHEAKDIKRTVYNGQELSRLPYGLDLKLENLVLSKENKLKFVDLFGPKELDGQGGWLTYSTKLDSLPPDNLKAVTATREGALLRFYRLTEKSWVDSSGIKKEDLRRGFLKVIRAAGFPEEEINFIELEVNRNFSWLDNVYSEKKI